MLYINEPHLILSSEDGYIKARWLGSYSEESFRQGLEKVLELIEQKKTAFYLINVTKSKVISPDEQNWMTQNWSPRAYLAGLRKKAFIVPQDVATQMAVRSSTALPEPGIANGYFDNELAAIEWLKQK
jgi:hypothetical protein